jgi:hypothetical protein
VIQREADEKIAHATRLAREAEKGKWHNGLQDDSGASVMSLGMAFPQGDTTHSSIHGAQLTEIDFGTGHDQSERK